MTPKIPFAYTVIKEEHLTIASIQAHVDRWCSTFTWRWRHHSNLRAMETHAMCYISFNISTV